MNRRHRGVPWGLALVLTLAAHMLAQLPIAAQDATTPLWPMYGVPDDEFLIGAWLNGHQNHLWTDTTSGGPNQGRTQYLATPIMSLWQYLDFLGASTMRLQADPWTGEQALDSLMAEKQADSPMTRASRIILSNLTARFDSLPQTLRDANGYTDYTEFGNATNIVLYPFEEVDQPTWPSKFMTLGDTVRTQLNPAVIDRGDTAPRERVLADTCTTPGVIIASDVVFNWAPRETNRFPGTGIPDSTVQNASWPFENLRARLDGSTIWYIVAKLRLPDPRDSVPLDSAVLRLRLYWENPQNQPVLCQTFNVTKGSLGNPAPDDGKYSDVAFQVDMAHCGSGPGPLDPTGGSRRMNLSVEWVGTEAVGLRSISLRNEAMQIMLDTSTVRRGVSGEK